MNKSGIIQQSHTYPFILSRREDGKTIAEKKICTDKERGTWLHPLISLYSTVRVSLKNRAIETYDGISGQVVRRSEKLPRHSKLVPSARKSDRGAS